MYLYINDDVAELRDASHLWGQSVWKTEETLKTTLQDPLRAFRASARPEKTACCTPLWSTTCTVRLAARAWAP